jgi:hypothetical protein
MPETEITRIDPTTYDYLKAKLSSEIGSDVKASLFRQYWGWLAGFTAGVAVLGFVSVAKLIPEMVQASAERFIRTELSAPIAASKAQIKEFENLVSESRQRFEKSFGATEIRSDELNRSLAGIKRYSEDATRELLVLQSRIVDNKKSIEDLRTDLITSIKKDLVTFPDFEAASANIVAELLKIKEDVRKLQDRAAIGAAQTPQETARVDALQKIVATAAATERQTLPTRRATVFIQFAVLPRDTIKTFAAGLKDLGWTVPPEDREDSATGLKEIRYFYEEDGPKVTQLIADISEQIQKAGYARVEFASKPLLNFPKKPKPGTIEVWVGVVPPKG